MDDEIVIFEGNGTEPTPMPWLALNFTDAERFWAKKDDPEVSIVPPPKGTISVNTFIPTKEYTIEEFRKEYGL